MNRHVAGLLASNDATDRADGAIQEGGAFSLERHRHRIALAASKIARPVAIRVVVAFEQRKDKTQSGHGPQPFSPISAFIGGLYYRAQKSQKC
jgi:hypothetical protein